MASRRARSLLTAVSGLFVFFALASSLSGQDPALLRGRVADAADNPIPGAVVLLHGMSGDAGAEIGRDTADAAGAFELGFRPEAGALYFVATRIDGDIFIGEPFRETPAGGIVLRAGPGVQPLRLDGFGAAAGASVAAPGGPAGRTAHRGWWVAAIGAVLVGLVAWLVRRGRRRAPRARELMLEIARLDETRGTAGGSVSDETYRVRRAELRDRLVEALELDHDADRH